MKCALCTGEGYHEQGCNLKFTEDRYRSETLDLKLVAERFPDQSLLDTSITGNIQVCITWKDKEAFTQALEEVIARFQI